MLRLLAKDTANMNYKKTIKQIEHITLFDNLTIEQVVSTQETYFICSVTFENGDSVLASGPTVQDATDLLNDNMRQYVNNC